MGFHKPLGFLKLAAQTPRHSNSGRRAFELFRILVPRQKMLETYGNLRVFPPPPMPSVPIKEGPNWAQFKG